MTVRAYDELWNVEKRLYRVENFEVPGSPSYQQIAFFVVGLVLVVGILRLLGLNNQESFMVKYIVLPIGFSMFMTRIKFDGKRPDRFLRSIVRFYLLPRRICRYRSAKKVKSYGYDGKIYRTVKQEISIGESREEE